MTQENFWLCLRALAGALKDDESIDDFEAQMRQMTPKDRGVAIDDMLVAIGQLSRIQIRFTDLSSTPQF